MQLDPIGRVESPDGFDLDPIVIPIVGYTLDRTEVVEEIRFRPIQPAWASLQVIETTNAAGNIDLKQVMHFLSKCVLAEDVEKWREFLDRDDVMFEQTIFVELYKALSAAYAHRPTMLSSVSEAGGSRTRRTSRGGARSRASAASTASPST